jgi:hypothetical protein
MYHDYKFGKAYQEEMLREAGVRDERERGPFARRKVMRSDPLAPRDQQESLKGSQGRLQGSVGALSGLILLVLFIAMMVSRIM